MDNSKHKQSSGQPPQPPAGESERAAPAPVPLAEQTPTPLNAEPVEASPATEAPQPPATTPPGPLPVQPAAPSSQGGTPHQVPPKKKSRALLWGSIATILTVLIIATVVVVALMLSGPSKKDYADMQQQTQEAISAYRKVNTAEGSERERSTHNYKDKVTALKDAKALKDKDVKGAYEAFRSQNEPYSKLLEQLVARKDAVETLTSRECRTRLPASMSDLERYPSTIKNCRKASSQLEGMEGEVGEAAKATSKLYDTQIETAKTMKDAYEKKDKEVFSESRRQLRQTAQQIISKGPTKVARNLLDKHDPIKKLKDLDKLLEEKQKKK